MMRKREEKLLRYVKEGNLQKLKMHLKKNKKLDVNTAKDEGHGRTALHLACLLGDDAVVRCLLKFGADVSVQDEDGNTALHIALMEVLNGRRYAYSDIVEPLLRHRSTSLKIRNRRGQSSKQLLKEVKEMIKAKKDEEDRVQREAEWEAEERWKENQAEKEWQEKLAGEWHDEFGPDWTDHLYTNTESHPDNNSQYECYDDWADRVSEEYQRKHNKRRYSDADDGNHQKRRQDEEKKHFQRQLELEHEEYKQRSSKRIQEQLMHKKRIYERKCKEFFTNSETNELFYSDIPWPGHDNDVEAMIKVLLCDIDKSEQKSFKKFIRTQQIIWHPDKFTQKVGQRLDGKDRERILDKVTQLSQALNKLVERPGL
ncbi:NF-kappa-B inhibitor-like protein 1 [Glandiceps talaboti]